MLKTIQVSNYDVPVVFTFKWKGRELVQLVSEGKRVYVGLEEGSHCQYQDQVAGPVSISHEMMIFLLIIGVV